MSKKLFHYLLIFQCLQFEYKIVYLYCGICLVEVLGFP